MRTRLFYIKTLGLLILSIFLVLNTPQSSGKISVMNPGVFAQELSSIAPSPLDPATNYESQGGSWIKLMYEGLFQYTNNNLTDFLASLATQYTLSPDGLNYTFTIRTGVNFRTLPGDAQPVSLNAYTLAYSINRAIIMNDHAGPAWMIDDWIVGAQDVEYTVDMNVSDAQTFLAQQGVTALDTTHLQILLTAPFGGFIQTLMFPVAYAINPKAIIDNEPASYTTNIADSTFGMVPLNSFFPGMTDANILSNLGLPSNYDVANSGIVPQSDVNGPAEFTWLKDHSAGTGPYYLVDLVQGSNVDLAKNTNW